VITVQGAKVLLVGYFSAKDDQYEGAMAALAARVSAAGAQVVRQFVQRRGVSRGGVRQMVLPLSRRTLISAGKVHEIALVRQETGASAVIFLNTLTDHQRAALEDAFGCQVLTASAFQP
jgi:50S ribosomal subunit-associated GTPase HflX